MAGEGTRERRGSRRHGPKARVTREGISDHRRVTLGLDPGLHQLRRLSEKGNRQTPKETSGQNGC